MSGKSGQTKQKWWGGFSWSPVALTHWSKQLPTFRIDYQLRFCHRNQVKAMCVLTTINGNCPAGDYQRKEGDANRQLPPATGVNQDTTSLHTLTNFSRVRVSNRQFACQWGKKRRNQAISESGDGKLRCFGSFCWVMLWRPSLTANGRVAKINIVRMHSFWIVDFNQL